MSKFDGRGRAMSAEDWQALREEIIDLFSPGAPIDEVTLFAGRAQQIQKLRDTLLSKGRHAVVYGERGVGKTSLVNVFHLGSTKTSRIHRIYTQCDEADEFGDMWNRATRKMRFSSVDSVFTGNTLVSSFQGGDDVETVMSTYMANDIPIVIFDEFDRVKSESARAKMAATIKQLSNTPIAGMIIIVGIADNIKQLISNHESIARQLVQIQMPRMSPDEQRDVVQKRLLKTKMRISDDALWRITYLACGLPFYAHALGQAAALRAIEKQMLIITEQTIIEAIPRSFSELDHTILDAYVKATVETRKGNIFKEVLAACSLAEQDELGRFSAASVEAPLSAVIGRDMKAPAFSFHLNELCNIERGPILEKEGSRAHFRFRFVEPMMQPYVAIKSLSSNVMSNDILIKFSPQRQRELPL